MPIPNHWKYYLGCLLGGLFALSGVVLAQENDSLADTPFSYLLDPPAAILHWDQGWNDASGARVQLPHRVAWDELAVYQRSFDLGCTPDDTLFVVIEGLAWNAELELNGAFIATHAFPLRTWIIALPSHLLKEQNNRLIIRAYKGELVDFSPQRFVGFLGASWLMDRAQLSGFQKRRELSQDTASEKVAALVLWDKECGFCFDPHMAAKALAAAQKNSINDLYLPVFAHSDLIAFCKDAGFRVIAEVDKELPLTWLLSFPYEAASFRYQPEFWFDEEGNRTQSFGITRQRSSRELPWSLILLGLVPLFIAAAMRILSPAAYKAAWMAWRSPARGMDSWFDNLISNRSLNGLFTLFRIIQGASLTALWVWILRAGGLMSWLNLFKEWSILSKLFHGLEHPFALFGRAFLLYGGVVAMLLLLNTFLGRVFKRNDFSLAVTATENLASFPIWWFLGGSLLLAALIDLPLRYLALAFLLLFILWRVFILFFNAEKRLGITGGVKYLYICASIFPYLLLF